MPHIGEVGIVQIAKHVQIGEGALKMAVKSDKAMRLWMHVHL